MFTEVFSLSVGIGRPFMAYGPGQMDLTKLVPYVISHLLRGEVAELSSGRQAFDWVYIDDVVQALLAIGSRTDISGTTIDIGCGVLTPVRDVAEGLGRRLGAAASIKLGAIADRRLEPTRCADVDATARLINWRARISLEEGLDRTVEWYRTHLPARNASR
jgi:nucleoside-diphosphate-sugar epimerase